MEKAIQIANFYYQHLFHNLSLTVEKNKFVVITGPNNCGKTTLARILSREIITENDIEILGRDINYYPVDIYSKIVGCVIPMEQIPSEMNIEEEMYFYSEDSEEIDWILKGLKMKRIIHKNMSELTAKEFVLYQLAVSLVKNPMILIIDDIYSYFKESEILSILSFLKEYQEEKEMTLLYIARNLKESLLADILYIIGEKRIFLKGLPMEVLRKDNVLNKIGLGLPFIVDLSVKLMDYDLLDDIVLEKDRMVDVLWKSR